MKILASTNSKLLAIFWYADGKFIGPESTLNGEDVIQYGNYLQIDKDHFTEWDKYKQYTNEPREEYDYYPRGRILFNVKIHKFVVIGDKKIIDDPEVKDKLLSYYGLPVHTIFESDEHYQSTWR